MTTFDPGVIGVALAAAGGLLGVVAAGHAVIYKRRSRAAFGWIAVCFTFPFVGALLYFLFGINRVNVRARKLLGEPRETDVPEYAGSSPSADLEPLSRLGLAVTGSPLIGHNGIDMLHNGEEAFPAMLEAIEGASDRVYLSTYIFEGNATGRDFVSALARAATRGADVRVLLDGIGELYSCPRARRLLRGSGVRVARFLPPRILPPTLHINLRNHRKILVADDTAFTGGINIGDRHLAGVANNPKRVVDIHFRIRGPIVAEIESVFAHDWQFSTREAFTPPGIATTPAGAALCRTVVDGPADDLDRLTAILLGGFGVAKRRILIMTPYFLPPREIIGSLQAAALRGVDVAVIMPRQSNLPVVHRATRHMLWELLQRGVNIYYQPPPFVHSKLLIIDDEYAQIGSANMDMRSLRLNFELTIEIYSSAFVSRLSRHFGAVRGDSSAVTLEEVDRRGLGTRLVDGVAWLFQPYL